MGVAGKHLSSCKVILTVGSTSYEWVCDRGSIIIFNILSKEI